MKWKYNTWPVCEGVQEPEQTPVHVFLLCVALQDRPPIYLDENIKAALSEVCAPVSTGVPSCQGGDDAASGPAVLRCVVTAADVRLRRSSAGLHSQPAEVAGSCSSTD